jgi:excinuclease UvrABC ATPase subunit
MEYGTQTCHNCNGGVNSSTCKVCNGLGFVNVVPFDMESYKHNIVSNPIKFPSDENLYDQWEQIIEKTLKDSGYNFKERLAELEKYNSDLFNYGIAANKTEIINDKVVQRRIEPYSDEFNKAFPAHSSNSITIKVGKQDYYRNDIDPFGIGEKIILGKSSYWIAAQKIKNKLMVHRLKRKKYKPQFTVLSTERGIDSFSLRITPYNF